MSDNTILVANSSVLGEYDGQPLFIHQGVTTVRAGHPLLERFGDLFEPLRPMFEVDPDAGQQTGADAEETAAKAPESGGAAPDPKDVRAWAAEQGIEVSAKGKLPAEVVERYQAAHTEA